jgi:hypothetical protein
MSWTRQKPPLSVQAARIQQELRRQGIEFQDMRRGSALELEFAGAGPVKPPSQQMGIEPLEGPIIPRSIRAAAGSESRLRYFVDGAQRTLPCNRIGGVPTAVSVSAVGVIDRKPGGKCTIARGSLRMSHTWLVPRVPGNTELEAFENILRAQGFPVIDPLRADLGASAEAHADYTWLMSKIYDAGLRAREEAERTLLTEFWSAESHRETGEWILVDGRLHQPLHGAIGLVKQFSNSYLSARDAAVLMDLPTGSRTTAFHPADRFRAGAEPQRRTLWYMRMWDATGQDARHALVRVEAHGDVQDSSQIDQISSWLLAERTPRATGDQRWATLLYPVHQLERALKRMIDGETNGWASQAGR